MQTVSCTQKHSKTIQPIIPEGLKGLALRSAIYLYSGSGNNSIETMAAPGRCKTS